MAEGNAEGYDRHLLAGGQMLRESNVEAACREFEAALGLRPGDPKALGLLGLVHFRRGSFVEAKPVYEKLVEVRPDDASYRLNLGLVYLKLGDAGRAIEQLAASRDLDPGQSRTISYLGLAYARGGEYAKAYEAFLQAGQSDLASEMEQHLSKDARDQIAAVVVAGKTGATAQVSGFVEALAGAGGEEGAAASEIEADDVIEEHESPVAGVEESVASQIGGAGESEGAVSQEAREPGMISKMVKIATPSPSAESAALRTTAGHSAPRVLARFVAERMVRPNDGESAIELSGDGYLVIRVDPRIFTRTEGVIVSAGEIAYEQANRRVRGASTGEVFGEEGEPLFTVSGTGFLVVSPRGAEFSALMLAGDVLYLREELVFAFEDRIRWENGHVPGSNGSIRVVGFRGEGALAARSERRILSVKMAGDTILYVDGDALAGWTGKVMPRLVASEESSAKPFVECSGEGTILLADELGGDMS